MNKTAVRSLVLAFALMTFNGAAFADDDKVGDEQPADSQPASTTKKPVTPIHFNKEQQAKYFPVYEKPQVKFLRKALNTYLAGKSNADETKELAKFSKDYYKSKFTVMSIDPCALGGTFLTVMFQDKPDKVFSAWVYLTPRGPELRSMELAKFTDDQVKDFQIQYKEMLDDKVHAM